MQSAKMALKISINKIVMKGFASIKDETTVQLDPRLNLVDGSAHDVKQTIVLAIEFLFSRDYEEKTLALHLLHEGVDTEYNQDQAFVTLHFSANKPIELNNKKANKFVVTRYLHEENVNFVYFPFQGNFKSQKIELFHIELAELKYTCVHDPIMCQRTHLTSVELNQILVKSLGLPQLMKLDMDRKFRYENDQMETSALNCILKMEQKKQQKVQSGLIEMRNLEAAILQKSILNYRAKYDDNDIDVRAKCREYSMFLKIAKFETLQRNRFETYHKLLNETVEIQYHTNTDLIVLRDTVLEPFSALDKYASNYGNKTGQSVIDTPDDLPEKIQELMLRIRTDAEENLHEIEQRFGDLNNFAQRSLDQKAKSLQQMLNFLNCTNELAWAELTIKEFCERQTIVNPIHIEQWRVGLMALIQMAHDTDISDGFVGNILDFVDPEAESHILTRVLPLLLNYTSMFIFNAPQAADRFKSVVKQLLKTDNHIYVYSVHDLDMLEKLPIKTLADCLLNPNSHSQCPSIGNWFGQFRIISDESKTSDLVNMARDYEYIIVDKHGCYDKFGVFWEAYHSESAGTMKKFLLEWQECTKLCKTLIKNERIKFTLEMEMAANDEASAAIEKQQKQAKLKIANALSRITSCMSKNFELLEVLIEAKDMKIGGSDEPDSQRVLHPEVLHICDAIMKFEAFARKLMHNLADNVLPLTSESVTKFQNEIQGNGRAILEAIDFKQHFDILTEPEKPIGLAEMYAQKSAFEEELKLLAKLNMIQKYPSLLDKDKVQELSQLDLDSLVFMKTNALKQLPKNLILPDLDAEHDTSMELHDQVNRLIFTLNGSPPNYETFLSATYFENLMKILRIMSYLDDGVRDGDIGLELSTPDDTLFIFNGTVNPEWHQRFPIETLCHIGTGLSFIRKSNSNVGACKSDLLDVTRNQYCVLFHLALAAVMNDSLIILNNTIVGMPTEELQKLIALIKLLNNQLKKQNRQVIIVDRSSVVEESRKLFNAEFHEISASKVNDQVIVTIGTAKGTHTD